MSVLRSALLGEKIEGFRMERIIFGLLIFCGYFGIGAIAVIFIPPDRQDLLNLTSKVLDALGPLLGVIVYAIWPRHNTPAEGRSNDSTVTKTETRVTAVETTESPKPTSPTPREEAELARAESTNAQSTAEPKRFSGLSAKPKDDGEQR